ncbi:hypothetical protein DW915_14470 [Blautia sp. AM42-2]|nr:hypothetical protein DW915_14470 [Blautia sp. AM42-2]
MHIVFSLLYDKQYITVKHCCQLLYTVCFQRFSFFSSAFSLLLFVLYGFSSVLHDKSNQKNSKKFLINGKSPVIMRGIKTTRKSRQRSLKKKISLLSALFCVQKGGKP